MRIEDGSIIEARVWIEGTVAAGTVLTAILKRGGRPAVAMADGAEYLLPNGAPGITEGGKLDIEVTRELIPGGESWKRPLARPSLGVSRPPDVTAVLPFPSPGDVLEAAGWSDLLDEARSGIIRFAGGELRVSPTPAMTLIDVDGTLPPFELAKAGARCAARAVLRHGIGGSIGIDLPTVAGKAERAAIAAEVDGVLPQPFERTTVNGFGFLQIVRPRRHASLFELTADRAAFEARALMRRVGAGPPGAKRLVAHPAIIALLETRAPWLSALGGQIGGAVTLRAEATLAMSAAYAEPA